MRPDEKKWNLEEKNTSDRDEERYGRYSKRNDENFVPRRREYITRENDNRSYGERSYNSYGRENNYSERPRRERIGNNYNRNNYNSDRPYKSYNRNLSDDNSFGNENQRTRRPRIRTNGNEHNYENNQRTSYNRYENSSRPYANGNRGNYNPNAKYSKKKQNEYRERFIDPEEPIRLNKYLANAGLCSRREADEYILAGVVTVNGEVVSELGTKVKRGDKVMFHDQAVKIERKVYILLNKPKNCVTTTDDPQERMTVMNLVQGACRERIYPVGRLDRNTTGVLLLTNDGELASKLTHPKFVKKKIYQVTLDKPVTKADMEKIADGIELEDGEIYADAISYVKEDIKNVVGIEIHSGRNRIVRRIFEALGYRVYKLDRVYFAGLTKKGLLRGKYRFLNDREVNMLRMGAFE